MEEWEEAEEEREEEEWEEEWEEEEVKGAPEDVVEEAVFLLLVGAPAIFVCTVTSINK